MSISIDVNMRMEALGPVYYHGHWISYGVMFDEWSMRCIGCEKEIDGSTEDFYELDETHEPYFWMSKFAEYQDECSEPYDSYDDALLEKIMMDHAGDIATSATRDKIENRIENEILVGPVDAKVSFK